MGIDAYGTAGGAAKGAEMGAMLGPAGALAGGILGAGASFIPGLKKESPQKQKKHVLQAIDPEYYDKSRIRYGDWLAGEQAWGSPSAAMYYNGQTSPLEGRNNNLLDYFGGDWKNHLPVEAQAGHTMGQTQDMAKAKMAQKTFQDLAGSKVPQMQGMFSQQAPMPGQGFGTGNGNMGQFNGGYGGPLPMNNFNGTMPRASMNVPRLMPGG